MRDLSLALPTSAKKTNTQSSVSRLHWNYLLLVLIVVLAATYVLAANSLSTKGLAIKQLQLELDQLQTQQKALQLQSSNLQSINLIQNQAAVLGFVPTGPVTYLKDSNFALK